jgi:phosphoribosylformylglycinamidine synthase
VLRIGVADTGGALELQDVFTIPLDELQATSRDTLAAHFGPVVGYPAA